jgi:hypothetical protein
MARRRCTECRKRFTAAVSAAKHQQVCGAACRRRRRSRLARRRRREDLDGHRADERARQEKRREGVRSKSCHELPCAGKPLELLVKLEEIVDEAARLSRATIRRETQRILRRKGTFSGAEVGDVGRCHEPPSALVAAQNGFRSAAGRASVTDQPGGA